MAETRRTPAPRPGSRPRRELPAPVVVALAVGAQAVSAGARGGRRLAAGLGAFAAAVAGWVAAASAAAIAELGRRGRRCRDELAVVAPPLQEDALAGWRQVAGTDLPRFGRWLRAVAGTLAAAALQAGAAAGRRARPLGARGWGAVSAAGRRLVPATATLALAGWFLPGPALQLAARAREVGRPPFPPLAQRSVIVASDGTPLGVVHGGENRRSVPLASIPPVVRRLVVLAEDRRFFEHEGFDQAAIVRASLRNGTARGIRQGASTITQQLVKNNLVGEDRTPARKLRELVLAVAVERRATKAQLLERYLNEVYFGAGAYGIAAAAETYFGVPHDRLRPEQAALLAVLIRSPSRLDPWQRPGPARDRRDELLRAAGEAGVLPPGRARALARRNLGLLDAPRRPGVADPDLVAAVEREIAARPELGPDPATRLRRLRSAGWTVDTTVSPRLQAVARAALDARAPAAGAPGAAVAAVEPGTGRIRVLASIRPPEAAHLELASSGRRQPGSAFKPLAAVAALEAGLDPRQPLEGRSGVIFDLGRERWPVDNFGDRDHGAVDLATALRDSVNSALAQVGVALGAPRLAGAAARLGIDPDGALGPPSAQGPAMALGGILHGVTPLEMAGAYAALAADGAYAAPTLIERIRGPGGEVVFARRPGAVPSVAPEVAANVRSMLESAVREGTGTRAALPGWAAFGKTGTSQDRADAWFAGAVPPLAAAAWVGDPRGRVPMAEATGGGVAAPLWRDVMEAALRGLQPAAFPPPPVLAPAPGLALPAAEPEPRPAGTS